MSSSTSSSKGSPRRFLVHAAVFLAGLAALFLACSVHYDTLRRSDNLDVQLRLFERSSPTVLFLGDSHPAMDIDMSVLGGRYANLSYPQENWREIFLKCRFALDAKPSIRAVVIPVDAHMFSDYRNRDDDLGHSMKFTRSYRDLAAVYPSRVFALRYLNSLKTHYAPLTYAPNWSSYRVLTIDAALATLTGADRPKRIAIDGHGSIFYTDPRVFGSLPEGSRREAARARTAEQLHEPLVSPTLVRALDSFLDLCHERGVAVVGVRYPLTPEFRAAAGTYDLGRVDEVYRARASRLAVVLDYSSTFDGRQDLFRDEDHLTRDGARVFTRLLASDLGAFAEANQSASR